MEVFLIAYAGNAGIRLMTAEDARRLTHINLAFGVIRDGLLDTSRLDIWDELKQIRAWNPDIRIVRQRVADPDDAKAAGLHGSPTILIDGVDPFAGPDTETSWTCRVFMSADGIQGAPSTQQLREVMGL